MDKKIDELAGVSAPKVEKSDEEKIADLQHGLVLLDQIGRILDRAKTERNNNGQTR